MSLMFNITAIGQSARRREGNGLKHTLTPQCGGLRVFRLAREWLKCSDCPFMILTTDIKTIKNDISVF